MQADRQSCPCLSVKAVTRPEPSLTHEARPCPGLGCGRGADGRQAGPAPLPRLCSGQQAMSTHTRILQSRDGASGPLSLLRLVQQLKCQSTQPALQSVNLVCSVWPRCHVKRRVRGGICTRSCPTTPCARVRQYWGGALTLMNMEERGCDFLLRLPIVEPGVPAAPTRR